MVALLNNPYNLFDLFLFPTGLLVVLYLSYVDLPYIFILAVCFLSITLYSLRFSLSLATLTRSLLLSVLHLFFREVAIRGRFKVPSTGPVLLACAPHVNQFVDPICIMSVTDRPVRFLCAAWSMRQPYIGDFARALNAIPVERAIDIAKKGKGRVTVDGATVKGDEDVNFLDEGGLASGWSFLVNEEALTVDQIIDARTLSLAHPADKGVTRPSSFYVAPRIDQTQVFANVWDSLGAGDLVGIFPEGGSHDQSAFLPFKAGVAIMALGAAAKYEGLPVKVVPVGLNYFQGHKFRSRVYLDVGDPIELSAQHVSDYKAGGEAKKKAIAEVLEQVHRSLRLVTATAPSYKVLHLLWAIRRLYTPDNVKLSVTQKLELTRRFESYYDKMKETEEGKQLEERVNDYNDKLNLLGIRDYQVMATNQDSITVAPLLLQRFAMLLAFIVAGLPGALLNAPIMIPAWIVSRRKAKEAIAEGMGVKLEGKDVMATWKLMMGGFLLLPCLLLYPIIAALIAKYTHTAISPARAAAGTALLQLPLMYASVRFFETGWDVARSLKPLWLAAIGHAGLKELRSERAELQRRVKELINVFGPKMWGSQFEAERLIKRGGEVSSTVGGVRKGSGSDARDGEDKVLDGGMGMGDGEKADRGFEKSHWIRLRGRKELGFGA